MLQALFTPINADHPVGQNIEYDEQYQQLLYALQPKVEQQFGSFISESEQIDWEHVYQLSCELLTKKSKDLRVMCYLTQSLIMRKGLIGLAEGLNLIEYFLQNYWDTVFPTLIDEDGDEDFDYRINALSIFTTYDGILKNIRSAFLIKNGLTHTSFSVQEIEILLDNINSEQVSYTGGVERLILDLTLAHEQQQEQILAIEQSLQHIHSIKDIYQKYLNTQLKFDVIEHLLSTIINKCATHVATTSTTIDEPNTEITTLTTTPTQIINWANYTVQSRQDVELLLEKIYLYFEKNEPSHPAPLFIRRIQKLLHLNFYEIMQDIHPDSIDRLELLVGQPLQQEDD